MKHGLSEVKLPASATIRLTAYQLRPALLSKHILAHCGLSSTGQDAAVAARKAGFRRTAEMLTHSNSQIADKAPIRRDCANGR